MKKSFGGWSTESIIDYTEKFDEVYNDAGQLVLETKQTFAHNEDDGSLPDFEYKYVVRCWDLPQFGSEDNAISVELMMVVLPKYYHADKLKGIMSDYGVDSVDELYTDMCLDYAVRFADEYVDYDEDNDEGFYYVLDNPEVVENLNVCASVLDAMNAMRGFKLDAAWNMIGTNGWDVLRDVLLGEDMIKSTLARYK